MSNFGGKQEPNMKTCTRCGKHKDVDTYDFSIMYENAELIKDQCFECSNLTIEEKGYNQHLKDYYNSDAHKKEYEEWATKHRKESKTC